MPKTNSFSHLEPAATSDPPLQTNFNRQTDTRNSLKERKKKNWDGKYLKFKGSAEQFEQ